MEFLTKLAVGALLKFLEGPYTGPYWKVIELLHFKAPNGEQWVRATLDKDTKRQGGELILEFYPSDPRVAYIITKAGEGAEDQQPFPPPIEMPFGDVVYRCLDPAATDDDNPGYDAMFYGEALNSANGQLETRQNAKLHHWEYENETQDGILQIFLQDGWVEIFTGVKVDVSNLTIF